MAAVRCQKLFAVVTRNIAALKDTGDHTEECTLIHFTSALFFLKQILKVDVLRTVNPLLSPRGAYFFQALLRGGLFNLAKRITYSKNTVV